MLRTGASSASTAAAIYRTAYRARYPEGDARETRVQGYHAAASLALTPNLHTKSPSWRSRCRAALQSRDAVHFPSFSHVHTQHRAASTKNFTSNVEGQESVADAERATALAAAEDELRHLREDVGAIDAAPHTGEESTAVLGSAGSTSSSLAVASQGSEDSHQGGASAGEEPTLEDLDRSIPQVDSEFIASLIRSRNLRREEFLTQKEAVKQRVDQLSKKAAPSVSDAAHLPLVGGLGFGWLSNLTNSSGDSSSADGGVVATTAEAPIVASAEVLEQLSEAEKDLLHTTRPEYDDGFVLIDCRTVNEVTSWGIIEGAKVLPAHELFEAFHSTPEEFLQDYGFAKPRPDDIIICYCQYGPRSLMAAQILSWMGYLKVMHYRDGYYEWGKQYNLLLRRWMEHDKESGNELRRLATFRAALELQRDIAPEFNALPMQEAQKYLRDTTRSPGKLLVGDGLRAEAYNMVAKLTEGLPPTSLPGVLEGSDTSSLGADKGTASGLESKSTQTRRIGENQLAQFLEQATGMNPQVEMQRSASSVTLGEAQATILDSLSSGGELGVSPDVVASPQQPRSRPN